MTACVRSGLDVFCDRRFTSIRGSRIGLVTHPAAVNHCLCHAARIFAEADGVKLAALFGPEHGIGGEAQDLIGVPGGADSGLGLRVYSLYGASIETLRPTAAQ